MSKKRDAEYWRNYRLRRRERGAQGAVPAPAAPAAPPQSPAPTPQPGGAAREQSPTAPPALAHQWATRGGAWWCSGCGEGFPMSPHVLPPEVGCSGKAVGVSLRRKRMKSDVEVRNHVIMILRSHAQNPVALIHLLVGYIDELQGLMKRDREDEFADQVCEHRHPGKLAQGLYCRMCHDAEMAGKFGSLPTSPHPSGDLMFPGDAENQRAAEAGPASLEDSLLGDIKIKLGG